MFQYLALKPAPKTTISISRLTLRFSGYFGSVSTERKWVRWNLSRIRREGLHPVVAVRASCRWLRSRYTRRHIAFHAANWTIGKHGTWSNPWGNTVHLGSCCWCSLVIMLLGSSRVTCVNLDPAKVLCWGKDALHRRERRGLYELESLLETFGLPYNCFKCNTLAKT
jgi:hypothetical protein